VFDSGGSLIFVFHISNNNLVVPQPYEPSDGFSAMRTIWLGFWTNSFNEHALNIFWPYTLYATVVATCSIGEAQFLLRSNILGIFTIVDGLIVREFVFERELDIWKKDTNFRGCQVPDTKGGWRGRGYGGPMDRSRKR
jgi:hypothetical protein